MREGKPFEPVQVVPNENIEFPNDSIKLISRAKSGGS